MYKNIVDHPQVAVFESCVTVICEYNYRIVVMCTQYYQIWDSTESFLGLSNILNTVLCSGILPAV